SLNSEVLKIYSDYSFEWLPIGVELHITKAVDNRVYTINNKTAYDTYAYYFGDDIAKMLPAVGIEFPLIIKRDGVNIARAVVAKEDDGSLVFAGNLHDGDIVMFGYGNNDSILSYKDKHLNKFLDKSIESIFIYSCMARRRFMPKTIYKETKPFNDIAPTSGFFTYGEFYSADKKELLNQTMTIMALSENSIFKKQTTNLNKELNHTTENNTLKALSHLISVSSKELQEYAKTQTNVYRGLYEIGKGINETLQVEELFNITTKFATDKLKFEKCLIFKHDDSNGWFKVDKAIGYNTPKEKMIVKIINILLSGEIIEYLRTNRDPIVHTQLYPDAKVKKLANSLFLSEAYFELFGGDVEIPYGLVVVGNGFENLENYSRIAIDNMIMLALGNFTIQLSNSINNTLFYKAWNDEKKGLEDKIDNRTKELKSQSEILKHQAHHDALTGLPNRILFNDRLEQAIEKAKRENTKIALLFIDLDHFKEINDSLGHEAGDKVLKVTTNRLSTTIREEDTLARLGGDEFTIILEGLRQGQNASFLASKIIEALEQPIDIEKNTLYVSSSIGISIYPDDGLLAQDLLKFADSAMYKAKDEGRNNYQYYSSEMTELAFERVVMETALRDAIKNEELIVYYQPQVDGVTNKLIGMEALVRWKHSTMGLVSPSKFIPLAESTGLIVELDRYVMKTAMKQIGKWYKDGLNPGILALNLAVKQLKQDDFIDTLKNIMLETRCKPEWIELELTEGQVMSNPEEAIKVLKKISNLGVELAIDDFGTGYSSLAYLKRLPINKLKIDQAFVRDLPDDEEDAGITKAVIALALSLNLKVIAEGVETKEQKEFMIENGCKNIQGCLYSKPVPADEFEKILRNGFKG
ncbi:MAG: EAL domain-containing protein, partial [Campylobacterota bacterium]|nr:EAL domain-containing protein [Campylobacterota bacterium]